MNLQLIILFTIEALCLEFKYQQSQLGNYKHTSLFSQVSNSCLQISESVVDVQSYHIYIDISNKISSLLHGNIKATACKVFMKKISVLKESLPQEWTFVGISKLLFFSYNLNSNNNDIIIKNMKQKTCFGRSNTNVIFLCFVREFIKRSANRTRVTSWNFECR